MSTSAGYTDYYVTDLGDQWDLISFLVYGSENYVNELMAANPEHISTAIFEAGVKLRCPDIAVTAASTLPPWRRSS